MRWFDKQSDAIEFRQTQGDDTGVFVLHKFNQSRRFCVEKYEKFCEKYMSYHIDLCHYYEVVCDDSPCKMYFDIDVHLEEDVEIDGSSIVQKFITYINHCLLVEFGLHMEQRQVLIMDSTSQSKFSQHLIFPEVVFKNNQECGNFVKKVIDAAIDALQGNATSGYTREFPLCDLELLMVNQGEGRGIHFVADVGVYKRNQHFRLYRSSKLNKAEHLVVAVDNMYPVFSEKQLFNDSLILYGVNSAKRVLTCKPADNGVENNTERSAKVAKPQTIPSDYPYLDQYVLDQIRNDIHFRNAVVHRVVISNSGMCIAYTLTGSKWCNNVQREHSNNRTYFCVNMKYGKIYQMCNSFPCRKYRSPPVKIPNQIWAKYQIGDEELLLQQLIATDDIADGIEQMN